MGIIPKLRNNALITVGAGLAGIGLMLAIITRSAIGNGALGLWALAGVTIGLIFGVVGLILSSLSLGADRKRVAAPITAVLVSIVAFSLFGRTFADVSQAAFANNAVVVADAPISVSRPSEDSETPGLPVTGEDETPTGTADAPFLPGTTVRQHGWEITVGAPDGNGWPLTVMRTADGAADPRAEIVISWVHAGEFVGEALHITDLAGYLEQGQATHGTITAPHTGNGLLHFGIGGATPFYFVGR